MNISADLFMQVLMAVGAGVGSYAAIRYDLGRLHERATQALDSATEAHKRIDGILSR